MTTVSAMSITIATISLVKVQRTPVTIMFYALHGTDAWLLTRTAESSMTMPAPPPAVDNGRAAAIAKCGCLLVTAFRKLHAAYCIPIAPAASSTVLDSRRDLHTLQADRSMVFLHKDPLYRSRNTSIQNTAKRC
jgi:hypothetical protein